MTNVSRALALIAALPMLVSCFYVHHDAYAPVKPSRVSARGVTLDIEKIAYEVSVENRRDDRLLISATLAPGEQVLSAITDAPHTPLCSAPALPPRIVAERRAGTLRTQLLAVPLTGEPDGPTVLDVRVGRNRDGPTRCFRLLLTAKEAPWRRTQGSDFALQGGVRMEVPFGVEKTVSAAIIAPVGFAFAADPLRFGASAGIGVARCSVALCGESADGTVKQGPVLPLELNADYLFGSQPSRLGLSARYAVRIAWAPDAPGERRRVIHAPHLALLWLATGRRRPAGWPRDTAALAHGLEVPVGAWHDSRAGKTGWFAGIGFTSAFPIF